MILISASELLMPSGKPRASGDDPSGDWVITAPDG